MRVGVEAAVDPKDVLNEFNGYCQSMKVFAGN